MLRHLPLGFFADTARFLGFTALVVLFSFSAYPVLAYPVISEGTPGTFIHSNVATIEATDASGMPLTVHIDLIAAETTPEDAPHYLSILFLTTGYKGAAVHGAVLPNRSACIQAGAMHLRQILRTTTLSDSNAIERNDGSTVRNVLNVASFAHWVNASCEALADR